MESSGKAEMASFTDFPAPRRKDKVVDLHHGRSSEFGTDPPY
jgi:hypothetical protein